MDTDDKVILNKKSHVYLVAYMKMFTHKGQIRTHAYLHSLWRKLNGILVEYYF